jgi:hypothetical protein
MMLTVLDSAALVDVCVPSTDLPGAMAILVGDDRVVGDALELPRSTAASSLRAINCLTLGRDTNTM